MVYPKRIASEGPHLQDEASYICDACGEEIVIPLDLSAGESQEYVEDCPVCCRPNLVHVEIDEQGGIHVWAEAE
jgi:Cysteine-rich CPXCG